MEPVGIVTVGIAGLIRLSRAHAAEGLVGAERLVLIGPAYHQR